MGSTLGILAYAAIHPFDACRSNHSIAPMTGEAFKAEAFLGEWWVARRTPAWFLDGASAEGFCLPGLRCDSRVVYTLNNPSYMRDGCVSLRVENSLYDYEGVELFRATGVATQTTPQAAEFDTWFEGTQCIGHTGLLRVLHCNYSLERPTEEGDARPYDYAILSGADDRYIWVLMRDKSSMQRLALKNAVDRRLLALGVDETRLRWTPMASTPVDEYVDL